MSEYIQLLKEEYEHMVELLIQYKTELSDLEHGTGVGSIMNTISKREARHMLEEHISQLNKDIEKFKEEHPEVELC